MAGSYLRVFISGLVQELAAERAVIRTALNELYADAYCFEQDAGAAAGDVSTQIADELRTADLYVGLFWKGYGVHSLGEYELARRLGKPCLVYEKRADLERRSPKLQAFLDEISDVRSGLTIRWFKTSDELARMVKNDFATWLARKVRESSTKPKPPQGIFLCYRRDDAGGYAQLLYRELSSRFRDRHVFMDVDSIQPGSDFTEAITEALEASRVLLALIGPRWKEISDERGMPRLANTQDYVRHEIAAAIAGGVIVVPVLLGRAKMPDADELPDDLAELVKLQAAVLGHDNFSGDLERLLQSVSHVLEVTS
jgi:hypothetical protein